MSKITFRADDDLVQRLEAFDASKSEVMREALRAYLNGREGDENPESVDDALAERVDKLIAERLDAHFRSRASEPQDVNVNITLDGATGGETRVNTNEGVSQDDSERRKTSGQTHGEDAYTSERSCGQCGEITESTHVYCPNCGEKASHRVFCDCGDEIRSDWAFCPGCGRRTPAADVLDRA